MCCGVVQREAGGGSSWRWRSTGRTWWGCWTLWRWRTGTRGWRWPGPSSTWLRVGAGPWSYGLISHIPCDRQKSHPPCVFSSSGVFDECDTEVDVLHWSRNNVFLLYDMGIFTALLELLSMEIEWVRHCSLMSHSKLIPPTLKYNGR